MRDLRSLLADVTDCIGFFTRLPVAGAAAPDRAFAPALWAAPIAGLAVALVGLLFMAIAAGMGMPPAICAFVAIAATMVATGALHEDGLSDTVDGFFGGFSRERRLEIMKDSRIGTFGAAALVFSIALRAAALAAIGPSWEAACAVIAAHMASRALLPAMMHDVPPAKPDGLAASVGTVPRDTALAALALGAASLLLLGLPLAVGTAAALALVFLFVRRQAIERVGGQTGDVLGALQQLAETAALCAAAAAFA
jgi:adenosylcobinamide-GDP ribazoletransferase